MHSAGHSDDFISAGGPHCAHFYRKFGLRGKKREAKRERGSVIRYYLLKHTAMHG